MPTEPLIPNSIVSRGELWQDPGNTLQRLQDSPDSYETDESYWIFDITGNSVSEQKFKLKFQPSSGFLTGTQLFRMGYYKSNPHPGQMITISIYDGDVLIAQHQQLPTQETGKYLLEFTFDASSLIDKTGSNLVVEYWSEQYEYNGWLTSYFVVQPLSIRIESNYSDQIQTSPPIPTIVDVSDYVISDEPNMNTSLITFTFDQDVTEWTVNVIGTSNSTGVVADSGGFAASGTQLQAVVDWNELYSEGENKVNIYGKNSNGDWTLYQEG